MQPGEGTPMLAYLGLASHPAQVQSISADRVALLSDFSYSQRSTTAVELVNDLRTFKCILSIRVTRVQPRAAGGYIVEGEFTRQLTAEELRDLSS
jgi:hypothetical protein